MRKEETENAVNELVARLDEKHFFEKFCQFVCPVYANGKCSRENCSVSKEDKIEFWMRENEYFS